MGAKQSQESSGSTSSTPEPRQRHATNASSSTAASGPSMGHPQPSHQIIHVVGEPSRGGQSHYLTARPGRDSPPDSSPLFPHSFPHSHHHHSHGRSEQSGSNRTNGVEGLEGQRRHGHDRPPGRRRRPREYRVGNQQEYMDFDFELNFPVLTERLRAMTLTEDGMAEGRAHRPRHHHRHRTGSHGSRSRYQMSSSVPAAFLFDRRTKCPLCSKEFLSSELEEHLVSCVNKPRVSYNVDTLQKDSGECSICLDDMLSGDVIARLPCLCIYHMKCLKQWYEVSQTCPEHPEFVNDNL